MRLRDPDRSSHPLLQLLLLIGIGAAILLPLLGSTGLTSSEGHRVVPALEMLASGEWLVPHMFEQAYIRKPQGVFWIFAAALAVLPGPEFGPRAVSAFAFITVSVGSWFFAQRWFGRGAGLVAGFATLLTPLYWMPARSAEIESLNNLVAAFAVWITIDLIHRRDRATKTSIFGWGCALGSVVLMAMLIKGPAGLPGVLGVLVAAAALTKSWRVLVLARLWIPVLVASLIFGSHWSRTVQAAGPDAIAQAPSAFMFESGQMIKLLGFIPVSLVTALPVSLAILFPWGPDTVREHAGADRADRDSFQVARLIALGCVMGLLVMLLSGVSNDRYAQPVLIMLGPLVGWIAVSAGLTSSDWSRRDSARMMPKRARIARWMMLGSPKVIGSLLLIGALVHMLALEPRHRVSSGRAPGIEAALALHAFTEELDDERREIKIVADATIEARPEVLLAMRSTLESLGYNAAVLWDPGLDSIPSGVSYLMLREQAGVWPDPGSEPDRVLSMQPKSWTILWRGRVHEFDFLLVSLETEVSNSGSER